MTAPKQSKCKSLLSTLLDAGVDEEEIVLAERIPKLLGSAGRFNLAIWRVSSSGLIETFYSLPGEKVRTWRTIEMPSYTGRIMKQE